MLWTMFFIGTICFLSYRAFIKPMYYWRRLNIKQGTPIPIFGNNYTTILKLESCTELVKRIYLEGKERYYGMYVMTTPILMLKDPELIKQITVKDFDYFTDHRSNFVHEDTDPIYSKNLFALKGNNWRDMRSTLSPAFTTSKMRNMFTLVDDCAKQFYKHYLQQKENEIVINIKDSFTRYSNDVIATCAFGINCDSLKEPNNEFYIMGREANDFTTFWKNFKVYVYNVLPTVAKMLKFKLFSNNVSIFFQTIIKNSLKIREEQHIIRPDMINLLMEARKGCLKYEEESFNNDLGFAIVKESHVGKTATVNKKEITDFDIAAQALAFFVAGFETVSTTLSFIAYELAVNSDVQEKVNKEIKEVKIACNGKLSYDDLAKLKYMDMVISETLRKWPSVMASDRVCVKPYTIEAKLPGESPVHLNIGDIVCIPTTGIHYDPEFYPNPNKFNPDRFNEENKHNIKQFTYMPFGTGPRNCIGSRFAMMEIKTVFYYLLQYFDITVVDKTIVPIKLDKNRINIAAKGGVWVGLKKKEL